VDAPPAEWRRECELPLGPVRGAYSSALPEGSVDDDVAVAFADALDVLHSLGVELVADSPDFGRLSEPFTTIAEGTFAGLAHEMTDDQLEKVDLGPRQLIDHGRRISAGAYYAAQQVAGRESASILRFWEEHDLLVTP